MAETIPFWNICSSHFRRWDERVVIKNIPEYWSQLLKNLFFCQSSLQIVCMPEQ